MQAPLPDSPPKKIPVVQGGVDVSTLRKGKENNIHELCTTEGWDECSIPFGSWDKCLNELRLFWRIRKEGSTKGCDEENDVANMVFFFLFFFFFFSFLLSHFFKYNGGPCDWGHGYLLLAPIICMICMIMYACMYRYVWYDTCITLVHRRF